MNIDKENLSVGFSKAAKHYDDHAKLQQTVGDELLNDLVGYSDGIKDKIILDVGCGTGRLTRKMAAIPWAKKIVGLDISQGMIDFAKSQLDTGSIDWLCADAQNMPFKNHLFDFVFSNLTLQWCEPLSVYLQEIKRVLKPNGMLFFTTLLDGSLAELKKAWSASDHLSHVNDFISHTDLENVIHAEKFNIHGFKTKKLQFEFDSVMNVMQSIKQIGANNHLVERRKGLTGRKKIQQIIDAYQSLQLPNGHFPLSYHIAYLIVEPQS